MPEENKIKTPSETKNKVVKTYAEDMAEAIESGTGGLIKKMIEGEEMEEMEKENLSPESKKNKVFMITGLVFVLLTSVLLSFFLFREDVSTVSLEEQFLPLIFTDRTDFIEVAELDKDKIVQNILNKVKTIEVKKGGVEGIYLTENKKIVGFRKFLVLLESKFIPLGTNFMNDHFLMGATDSETKDFFILLKVRSISDVFDNIRTWESKMFLDLHSFFDINITTESGYLLTENFTDGVIENKNARILYSKAEQHDSEIALMYVFADDTSIIIANSRNAVAEIIRRLASSQIKK
jgi:hypothetical protein